MSVQVSVDAEWFTFRIRGNQFAAPGKLSCASTDE